ncbi:MAG: acyl-CoA thioesterase [Silicimonas sp.]|jgi:acyl-CoA thioester hydrolase|nr:acyl-CoA thioesterase [Silicimonas sp.]
MTDYIDILDRPALEALGIDGYAYGYADRVRFYELDALNHVNNVVFLKWFETIRVRYVQDYGLTRYGAPDDPQLVVRRVTADFLAPMFQNQAYVVTTRTTLVKPSSFVMEYGLFVDGEKKAAGEAVGVSLTPDGSARQPHRPEAVARMIERDGATDQT